MSTADTASRAETTWKAAGRVWRRARRDERPAGGPAALPGRGQPGELALWAVLTGALVGATALLAAIGVRFTDDGSDALPLAWPPRLTPITALAPALAAGTLTSLGLLGRRAAGRPPPPFGLLTALAYLGTVGWWLALGAASRPGERVPDALLATGASSPGRLLDAAAGQPPGPELLV